MVKVKFKDLSGWLKFGAIVSITLGIIYSTLLILIVIGLMIPS